MKKPLMLLVALCAAQFVLAQPFQRKAEQVSADEFTLQYTFFSDSLKGFFMITEELTGKAKLIKAKCKWPYRFENGRLQVSDEKISVGTTGDFTFKMLEKNVRINGSFRSENYGHTAYEKTFKEIRLEKAEPLLAMEKQNPALSDRHQQAGEMYSEIDNSGIQQSGHSNPLVADNKEKPSATNKEVKSQSSPLLNDLKSTINNGTASPDTIYPISFRVQLAASTTPIDKQKISKLSGLGLPVYEDRIDNYYKYTIGNETSLKEAQALLGRVTSANFKKPFIVAYRDKSRITVQEAVGQIIKQP